ncbi:MAG: sortase [Chloroflexaceae bacterium]|nr:sortase [Chloroflexaceae bacterium]NJL32738.1 sortase [Chloroflexaceae bacterium]
MKKQLLRNLGLILVLVLVGAAAPLARANTEYGTPVYIAETGHTLAYNFRQFYEYRGGLAVFGYPITEVFLEDGRPMQYFERARLEWHADLGVVQAGHLGTWAAREKRDLPPFQPLPAAPTEPNVLFFPETGHSLRSFFLIFWQGYGALENFGYPISEEFLEVNPLDGREYRVQYFERARFEYHPELPLGQRVQLAHLGRQYLLEHPAPAWSTQPVQSAVQAWDGLRPLHISVPRIGVDTPIEMGGFSYGVWEVPRYNAIAYWPVSAVPGTTGNIVLAGHVGYPGTIFNQLPDIQIGDEILVTTGNGVHRYRTQELYTLLPHEAWVMNPTPTETLTLITCVPIGSYSHRLIVRATPIE